MPDDTDPPIPGWAIGLMPWPDHADMVVWLLERLDEAEARAALAEPSDG